MDPLGEAHARVALHGAVEPVVMVGDAQVPEVLRGVPVVVAEQHRLVVVVEVVPRDGDVVGAALDVEQAVVAGREVAVVNPDVVRGLLDVDGVVVGVDEPHVADDDVLHAPHGQPAAADAGVLSEADDGLVGGHLVHRGGQADHAVHLYDVGAGPEDVVDEL